ncbi:MAG: hypothetical protein CMI52_01735 [Parcubacteria group bacterium]|nr:hypothetical protein [Parcubacteria group bacterium]|tara:strand:+ start:279 stop:794 length:516 start_codon:yes stop_codon:yes gene_type:complete
MKTIEAKDIASGQILRVHQKIKEGDKTRTQVFEGTVIKRRGGNTPSATFTIRKKATGNVFVEKIYPIQLPTIEKVELVKEFRKRRAQMTFLRNVKYKKKLKEVVRSMIGRKENNSEAKAEEVTEEPVAEVENATAETKEEKTTESKAKETLAEAKTETPEETKEEKTEESK